VRVDPALFGEVILSDGLRVARQVIKAENGTHGLGLDPEAGQKRFESAARQDLIFGASRGADGIARLSGV
jgi:hypothetical protein